MDINKTFIPFEQAKKLQEFGFDDFCFSLFTHNDKLTKYDFVNNKNSWLTGDYHHISAPTYQQAFDFMIKLLGGKIEDDQYEYSLGYVSDGWLLINRSDWDDLEIEHIEFTNIEALKKLIQIYEDRN